jgi:hypothetical protein
MRKNKKMNRNILYFDNATTPWPKPEATIRAVDLCLRETGGSPGRDTIFPSLPAVLSSTLVKLWQLSWVLATPSDSSD